MIRGAFSADAPNPLPYVSIALSFPDQPNVRGRANFVIDTGSDSTILSVAEAAEFGLDVSNLDRGHLGDIGGGVMTRVAEATLTEQGYSQTMTIHILEDNEEIPSLLGRDFISAFTLIIRQRDSMALLLDDDEADALNLPQ